MTATITPIRPDCAPRRAHRNATVSLRGTVLPGSLSQQSDRTAVTFELLCEGSTQAYTPGRSVPAAIQITCRAYGLLAILATPVELDCQYVIVEGDLVPHFGPSGAAFEVEAVDIMRVIPPETGGEA